MLRTKHSVLFLEASVAALYNEGGVSSKSVPKYMHSLRNDRWSTIEESWGQFPRFKGSLSMQFTTDKELILEYVASATGPIVVLLLSRSEDIRLLLRDRQRNAMCVMAQGHNQDESHEIGNFISISESEFTRAVREHDDIDLGGYLIQRSLGGESMSYKNLPSVSFEDIGQNSLTMAESVQVAALTARCERMESALYDLTEQLHSSFLTHPRDVEDLEVIEVGNQNTTDEACPVRLPTTLNPWRSTHNMSLPRRIILVRHGESLGNIDESTYGLVPDWKVPLTELGRQQGRDAGLKIAEMIGNEPVNVYTSPYLRTKQTLAMVLESLQAENVIGIREEPRLTEQQFGNFQDTAIMSNAKSDRHRYGRFYFRFPNGESGLDVYERVTSFIATLFRDFSSPCYVNRDVNVLIVTHGLTLRLLLMRWFQYTITDFENTVNPSNGEVYVMERKAKEWMELTPESCAKVELNPRSPFHGTLSKFVDDLKVEEANFAQTYREIMQRPEPIIPTDPDLIDISKS